MDTIKETIEEKKKHAKKSLLKVVAVAVSTGLLAVGAVAALDNIQGPGSGLAEISEPDPVVLDIDEADMADESESEEDTQEEKKRGFFSWLKIWFYGMLTGIAGFFATKIPWKKIFNKRNLIILMVLVVIFLLGKYVLPYYVDVPWGPEPTNAN